MDRLFSVVLSNWKRAMGRQEVPPEHKEELLHVWVTKHWNRLLRDAVKSPSLEILKKNLDAILYNVQHTHKGQKAWTFQQT